MWPSVRTVIVRGLLGSVLVLLGGWVVATLPPSTPMLEHHLLFALRGNPGGRMAGLTVVLLGLGMLASAWLTMCRVVAHDPDEHEGIALVQHATLMWAAPLVVAPPLFSKDGWSYAAQGFMAAHGISPYHHGPWVLSGPVQEAVDPRWEFTPAPYGPLPLWWGQTLGSHTGNPLMLALGHRFLALAGLAMLAWAVPRLAKWTGANPALASALVLCSPFMLANGVGGMHNDVLMIGLMAVALVVAAEHGWALAAVVGGLAAAVKLPGGLVCLGVVLLSLPVDVSLRRRLVRLAEVAAIAVGVVVLLGWTSGLGNGWVKALGVPGSATTLLSGSTLLGGALDHLAAWLHAGTQPALFLHVVRAVVSAAGALVVVVAALRWRAGSQRGALQAVAFVAAVVVVTSPVVQLWYLMWPLPFLAVLAVRRIPLTALVVASVLVGLVAPLDPSMTAVYHLILVASLLIILLVCVLLLSRHAQGRLERIATVHVWHEDPETGSLTDRIRRRHVPAVRHRMP